MHLHEYQAKELLAAYGIPVPRGGAASTPQEALAAAAHAGSERWVVKAQIHAGGRGKAGGVRRVEGVAELTRTVEAMLGSRLVTRQTGPGGQPVLQVLIESAQPVAAEFYLSLVLDRSRERHMLVASAGGGMDIEELAKQSPEQVLTLPIHPVAGLQDYHCRRVGFALGLDADQRKTLTRILHATYRLFIDKDLSLLELNPLVKTTDGSLVALDAKLAVDDNALYRQAALTALRDPSQEDPRETRARRFDLNYIALEGDIACMVNGAGLAMATMDLIKLHGGEPANFLDVGGGTTADRVAEAFKIISADPRVKAILVNIFGGIVRCDLIAAGIITAVREVGLNLPVVVRLEGTNVEQGRAMLEASGLELLTATDLSDAARKAVAAAAS